MGRQSCRPVGGGGGAAAAATVLVFFRSSSLFLLLFFLCVLGAAVAAVDNTAGELVAATAASVNHNNNLAVVELLETFVTAEEEEEDFRVSDKSLPSFSSIVLEQQRRSEYHHSRVSRTLLFQSDGKEDKTLESVEENQEEEEENSRSMLKKYLTNNDNSEEVAGILVTLSEVGITYVKEVLVNQILSDIIPLALPDIHLQVKAPVGLVDTTITRLELSGANVSHSDVKLGKTAITVSAENIKAKIHFHWVYQYTSSYIPFPVTDGGWADVEVTGMQAGATVMLQAQNGTLRVIVLEQTTSIQNLDIQLHGGASWLYQWFVYAFDDEIRAEIESAILTTINTWAGKLDALLMELPRSLPIDDTSAIDVALVEDPFLGPNFLAVRANGEFVSLKKPTVPPQPGHSLHPGIVCCELEKMVTIAISDYVINSAAKVYFEAGVLDWLVDELPQESILNTAFWKWIIPQLYKKYPNDDMVLHVSASAAPQVELTKDGAKALAVADVTVLVKTGNGSVPVACLSMTLSMDAIAGLDGINVTGEVTLNDLTLQLKWSDIGTFPVKLLQPMVRMVLSKVIIPILNINLKRGFPLPVIPAIDLQDADVRYDDGCILICSNVYYKSGYIKTFSLPFG
ncbi:unnamed protein product [Sphagnum compactum]